MSASSPHERETQLADDYLTTAILARNVANKALERTQAELEAGTLRDPAKAAVAAATAGGIMLDKRLILEGRPTQIHALEDPVAAGLALLKRHNITIDSTATDITDAAEPETKAIPQTYKPTKPTAVPLLGEGVQGKRASASN